MNKYILAYIVAFAITFTGFASTAYGTSGMPEDDSGEDAPPTPSPTPEITPTPTPTPTPSTSSGQATPSPTPEASVSSPGDQGPGGDCCPHDDEAPAPTAKKGRVLGASTKKFGTARPYECSLLPIIYPTVLNIFGIEINFPESDYWSFRVKDGAWQALADMANTMLWHKQQRKTYDANLDVSNAAINNRCVNKELIGKMKWIFQQAYGKSPNASEYGYWYRRLMRIEKISVPDLFGAMQWQLIHNRDHSNDINIKR